jgi:hypothetical protein
MRQATQYKACTRVIWATQATSGFLAVWCVFFGGAVAAFVPASVEERLVNLLVFGLVPAFVFYVSGHILRLVLGASCKLCELLVASVLRRLSWVATGCAKTLTVCRMTIGRCTQRPSYLTRIAYFSMHRQRQHLYKFAFDLSCLLIRISARSIIKAQHLAARHRNLVCATFQVRR